MHGVVHSGSVGQCSARSVLCELRRKYFASYSGVSGVLSRLQIAASLLNELLMLVSLSRDVNDLLLVNAEGVRPVHLLLLVSIACDLLQHIIAVCFYGN